jgi:hypothetical protein
MTDSDAGAAGTTGGAKAAADKKGMSEKKAATVDQLVSAVLPFLSNPEKLSSLPASISSLIQFNIVDNRGRIDNQNGQMTGVATNSPDAELSVSACAPGAGGSPAAGTPPSVDEDIEPWFEGEIDVRARCLAIAIAFLPGATLTTALQASDRLAASLLPKESKSAQGGFGKSRSALLHQVKAMVETGADEEDDGEERVRFVIEDRADRMRRYIWNERTDIRPRLIAWMLDLPRVTDAQGALTIGVGIGLSAPFASSGLFDAVILPWSKQGVEQSLLAAGEALGVAVPAAPKVKDRVARQLRDWTNAGSAVEDLIRAAHLSASSWGVAELEEALVILHRAESEDPVHLFGPVQRAVDLYWAWSSLVPKSAERIITGLTKGLERWDDGDRSAIICILPMVHLASAIQSEIGYLKAERPEEAPLMLRAAFQDLEAFRAAASWLERGCANRHTQKFVRAVLGLLLERARELGVADAFAALAAAMHDAANEDGKSRIRFFCESWKISPQPKRAKEVADDH